MSRATAERAGGVQRWASRQHPPHKEHYIQAKGPVCVFTANDFSFPVLNRAALPYSVGSQLDAYKAI